MGDRFPSFCLFFEKDLDKVEINIKAPIRLSDFALPANKTRDK